MLKKKLTAVLLATCVVGAPATFANADASLGAALDNAVNGTLSLLPGPLPPGDDDSGPVINPPGPKPPPK